MRPLPKGVGQYYGRFLAALLAALTQTACRGADWPMWRCDASRTATTSEALPEALHLQWVREYPPLQPAFWQIRQERLQFDLGYEPVVLGKTMFVGASRNDRVTALDVETGAEKWRFYADGPVRLAPAAAAGMVCFGSDDGFLYCLDAESGTLRWKVRGAPSARKALGNGRLISVWPARGGAVVEGERVYFAAGVWPFEGIFVHALDLRTGKPAWINDRLGSRYTEHPHAAMSFGGPCPQGYLLLHRGRLVLPGSRAFPAFLDRGSGELLEFDFGHGTHGSRPGSWFVASEPEGLLAVDPILNTETHDEGQQTIGQSGIRRQTNEALAATVIVGKETYRVIPEVSARIRAGPREFRFREGFPGVAGAVHTMLVAGGRLYVVNRGGAIYCFGSQPVEPKRYPLGTAPLEKADAARAAEARGILAASGQTNGYAWVWGLGDGRLAEALAAQSPLRVVAVDRDETKVHTFRRRLDAAGLYGEKIAAQVGSAVDFGWPPCLANLIVCESLPGVAAALGEKFLDTAREALRPYGGVFCVKLSSPQHEQLAGLMKRPGFTGAELRRAGDYSLVIRAGALPGAANYTGQPNYDARVKAPLGLLWFGDTAHHHKLFYQGVTPESGRGLPTFISVVDGVMHYSITEPFGPKPAKLPYPTLLQNFNAQRHEELFMDIYTGRTWSNNTAGQAAAERAAPQLTAGLPLSRENPLTGAEEAREYVKHHGCDLFGADYGHLITMRSGTAAFYDKRLESGTINISGLRSGCRNSIIPAGGILSLPAWTGNCSCNYPVFTSLALVSMPESFEQWSAWGGVAQDGPVRRVGINFGAPGDRMSATGTLWLEWPRVGGASPDLEVVATPETVQPFYRHSLWMEGGESQPWVFASGIKGVRSIRIGTRARARKAPGDAFSVRWTGFLQTDTGETNSFHARSDGLFRLWMDGFPVLDSTRYKPKMAPPELTGRIVLEPGRHFLQAEYGCSTPRTNGAFATLSWSSPSRAKTVIPPECLWTPEGRRGGLAGVYFPNSSPSGAGLVQVDPQIHFNWGAQKPARLVQAPAGAAAPSRLFTVRLVFAEPEAQRAGERVFAVKLQGKSVLRDFDIFKAAGGRHRGVIREFQDIRAADAVELEFVPGSPMPPLICGVELLAKF